MKQPNENLDREVDLSLLLKRASNAVGNLILSILKFILRCLSYLVWFGFKKYVILILALLSGIGIGIVRHYLSKDMYSSDMVLQSIEIPTEDMIAKINELGLYAGEGNFTALSEKLKIDTLATQQISGIGAYWFIDEDRDGVADLVDYKNKFNALEDTTSRRVVDLLAVRARVTNPDVFVLLQEGIINFLRTDPRLTLMNNNRKDGLQLKIERINEELIKLDSLQRYEYFDKEREMNLDLGSLGSLKLMGEEKDVRLLHKEIIELQDTRLSYERQLKVTGNMISVITDFPVSIKPIRSVNFDGLYYGLLILAFTYALLFILGHRKTVLEFLENSGKENLDKP